MPKATLVLQDKTRWDGVPAGAPGVAVGRLSVLNGAGHALQFVTDPGNAGCIACFTFPVIGSYGVNTDHCETGRPHIKGMVVRQLDETPSNWRSAETLSYFLRRHLIPVITGVDVRALTRHIRGTGPQNAALVTSEGFTGWDALQHQIDAFAPDAAFPAAVKKPHTLPAGRDPATCRLAVCDFGSSHGLTSQLSALGAEITLLPPDQLDFQDIRAHYDGLLLPPGPSVPLDMKRWKDLRAYVEDGFPVLGVGFGMQLLAVMLGARLIPLLTAHRGQQYPVRDMAKNKIVLVSQNHDWSVNEDSLPKGCTVTYRSAYDDTVEGFALTGSPCLGVQHLPGGDDGVCARFISRVLAWKEEPQRA